MNLDRKRAAIQSKLRRIQGAAEAHNQAISDSFRKANDLHRFCPGCKKKIQGTWEQVTAPCPYCGHGKQDG